MCFFFSSRRRHTRCLSDWSSDVCSSDLLSRDYALVLMLPNERHDQRVLLIYGIYTQGSQAAIEYVTNPDRLAELRQSLLEHTAAPKYRSEERRVGKECRSRVSASH